MAKELVAVGDINDAICGLLSRFAEKRGAFVDHHLPNRNQHGIDVKIGKNTKEGHALFRFATSDRFIAEIDVDFQELFADHKGYLDGMMVNVRKIISEAKQRRQEKSRIIIPSMVQ